MAEKYDQKKKDEKRLKIEASGGAGIIVIGCALLTAAVGAAFVAHRARGVEKSRKRRNEKEDRGLQGLLPSADHKENPGKEEFYVDGTAIKEREEPSVEIQAEGESEEGEEGSEGTGDSSAESNGEAVWPVEIIDRIPLIAVWPVEIIDRHMEIPLNDIKQQQQENDGIQNQFPVKECINERSKEFDSLVEHQDNETENSEMILEITENQSCCKDSTIVIKSVENKLGVDPLLDQNDTDGREFSFWSSKTNAVPEQTEEDLVELETAHVAEEGKPELGEQQVSSMVEDFVVMEDSDEESSADTTSAEKTIDRQESWSSSVEIYEMKEELEISKEMEDVDCSVGENNMRMFPNHLPSTDSIEQQNGHVSVDISEGSEGNSFDGFKNSEARERQSEAEQDGLSMNLQEEIQLPAEDMREKGEEGSEGSRCSSAEFSEQAIWHAEVIEQLVIEGSMSAAESKMQLETPQKIKGMDSSTEDATIRENTLVLAPLSENNVEFSVPNTVTDDNVDDLKITTDTEIEVAEEDKEGEDKQESSSVKSLEDEISSPVDEENEREGSTGTGTSVPMCEVNLMGGSKMIKEMVCEAPVEEDQKAVEEIPVVPSLDEHKTEISDDNSESIQDNIFINLDKETNESQNMCENSEIVMEVAESLSSEECLDANFMQDQNTNDLAECDMAHDKGVEDLLVVSQEAGTELSTRGDGNEEKEDSDASMKTSAEISSETEFVVEEKGLTLTENEMKLQFEIPKKTTDVSNRGEVEQKNEEKEQEVPEKESDLTVTGKERKTHFILVASSKVFLLLLALTLIALGLLAFTHHEHFNDYKCHLPDVFQPLFQLIFPSYNGTLGEL